MIEDNELNYLVEAAQRFHEEAGIPILENAKEYYRKLHTIDGFFSIVVIGKGFIVGHVAPAFLEPNKKLCTELAWYVEPEYRGKTVSIRLLKNYEKKAIKLGATQISMVALEALSPERLRIVYNNLGYNAAETHYIKEV